VAAATATGGLLIGDPDTVECTGLRGLQGEVIRGDNGCEVDEAAGELGAGDLALD
jgi:hypothetical protein